MGILTLLGGIVALAAYFPLSRLIRKNPEEYSFASMLLWSVLDCIATVSIYLQDGIWFLPLMFVIGSGSMALILFLKRQIKWGRNENIITLLIIVCLVIWKYSGNIEATIASIVATSLAGIPQLAESWHKPNKKALSVWILFTIGNLLTFFAGTGWDFQSFVEDRLCAAANGLFAFVLIFICQKKVKI